MPATLSRTRSCTESHHALVTDHDVEAPTAFLLLWPTVRTSDDDLAGVLEHGDAWDPVEERQALATVKAGLFRTPTDRIRLSRYVLLHPIGEGGGGVVYRAYDPELDRNVAVKVLRAHRSTDRRERLLREAQAVAKLSHPNVIAVYDVGTIPEDDDGPGGVFVVMELVDGVDLQRWLRLKPRRWEEVLDVFNQAGRGLAAAHARGIVHRDFKPANVLRDREGRVRVGDFGLARALEAVTPFPADADEPAQSRASNRLGTPAYMAPEQHLGNTVDARADQYAFCVSLYEALHGRRPFEGITRRDLLASKRRGPPPPPDDRVPRWLHAAIAQGLAYDSAERHPSMQALLAVLYHDRARRRRRMIAATSGVALLGLTAMAAARLADDPQEACREGARALAGVWDDEIRGQAAAAFTATHEPWAASSWKAVAGELDTYSGRWQDAWAHACAAASVSRQAFEATPSAACLARQRVALEELTSLLLVADAELVTQAVDATGNLSPPEVCVHAPEQIIGERTASDPEDATVHELDRSLLRAEILVEAGHHAEGQRLAETALAEVRREASPAGESWARVVLCDAMQRQRLPEAEDACREALQAAERAGITTQSVSAMLRLAELYHDSDRYREGEIMADVAGARLSAAAPGVIRDRLELELQLVRGGIWQAQHRNAEARTALLDALERTLDERGTETPRSVAALNALGLLELTEGSFASARTYFERAQRTIETFRGAEHPSIAGLLNNLGRLARDEGRLPESVALLERALLLKERLSGPTSPWLVTTLQNLANVMVDLDRAEEALLLVERARSIHASAPHSVARPGFLDLGEGQALVRLGRCDEAVALLDRAEDFLSRELGGAHDFVASVLQARAECRLQTLHFPAAAADLQRAREIREQALGSEHRTLVPLLVGLARIDEERGDLAAAREQIDRARRIVEHTEGDPLDRARVAFALSRLETDPASARAMAQEALELYTRLDREPSEREAVATWLASR